MKFGVKLETYAIPEWSDKYVRYNDLKKFLKRQKSKIASATNAASRTAIVSGAWWRRDDSGGCEHDVREAAVENFNRLLEEEVAKVEEHFVFESAFLDDRLAGISAELDMLELDTGERHGYSRKKERAKEAHLIRLQRAIVALWDCYEKLDGYAQLNHMAVYKILKKRDKEYQISLMHHDMKMYQVRFLELKRRLDVNAKMKQLYVKASKEEETFDGIEMLSAAVQRHFMNQNRPTVTWVAFFLGVCLMLLVDMAVCAVIPATNPAYNPQALEAVFPIYRLALMLILLMWGLAVDVYVFEIFGVNYKFLLDIDPRSDLKATQLFVNASKRTAFWIFGFGFMFVDYRFGICGQHDKYWIHPLAQLVGQVLLFLSGRLVKLKRQVGRNLWTTLRCGLVFIPHLTLTLNLIGDMLTSMAKPLGDLEYALCYYSTGLFHEQVAHCAADRWAVPLMTAIPFWIRFMQCLSRFREGGPHRNIHVGNMGKYLVSLLVVLATSFSWSSLDLSIYAKKLIFVFLYLVASLYSMTWDFVFDWGLVPDADNFLRAEHSRMYPEWLYYAIAMLNLLGRLTWALTLIPLSLSGDQVLNVTLIYLALAAIEITRRCAWILLRLENEHITNSSRYRAMLWVPRLAEDINDSLPALVNERAMNEESWARIAEKGLVQIIDDANAATGIDEETGSAPRPGDSITDGLGSNATPRLLKKAKARISRRRKSTNLNFLTLAAAARRQLRRQAPSRRGSHSTDRSGSFGLRRWRRGSFDSGRSSDVSAHRRRRTLDVGRRRGSGSFDDAGSRDRLQTRYYTPRDASAISSPGGIPVARAHPQMVCTNQACVDGFIPETTTLQMGGDSIGSETVTSPNFTEASISPVPDFRECSGLRRLGQNS